MCGHGEHHGSHGCCCGMGGFDPGLGFGPGMHFGQCFPTREERFGRLEEYLKEL